MLLRKAYHLARIRGRQWWDRDQIARHHENALPKIVRHAAATVPYYRQRFAEHGVNPAELNLPADVLALPINYKKDLAPLTLEERLSSGVDPTAVVELQSSGSTGEPTIILTSRDSVDLRGAAIIRTLLAHDVYPHRVIPVFGFPTSHLPRTPGAISVYRRVFAPVTESVDAQIAFLRDVQPTAIEGYPSYLVEVARELARSGPLPHGPRCIFTNSETLSDRSREIIRNGFGTDPINVYDCWEFGAVAWQCPERNGLHVNADLLYVEIMAGDRPAEPGEPGEIVVTDLSNRVAPLIRYSMQDLAAWDTEACTCGRGSPRLRAVGGRSNVSFLHADGREVPATSLLHTALQTFSDVSVFQAIQHTPGELELSVVLERDDGDILEQIGAAVQHRLGVAAVTVKSTDTVERGANGKVQTLISRVPAHLRPSD